MFKLLALINIIDWKYFIQLKFLQLVRRIWLLPTITTVAMIVFLNLFYNAHIDCSFELQRNYVKTKDC